MGIAQEDNLAPVAGRDGADRAIYISDLDRCLPSGALSIEAKRHTWRTVSYETDSVKGTMLWARGETAAPDVTYPLSVSGWHALYVGLYRRPWGGGTKAQVKLSRDRTYYMVQLKDQRNRPHEIEMQGSIDEVFWKIDDLTGQDLVVGQLTTRVGPGDGPENFRSVIARVAYIKLVPLSDEEVKALQTDHQRTSTRRLFAHDDSQQPHYCFRATTPEEIYRQLEPYRHSDFSRTYWEAAWGHRLNYLGQAGRLQTLDDTEDFEETGYRLQGESWSIFREKGLDPFKLALDYAHEIGLEFHASYRPAGFHYPVGSADHLNPGGPYDEHPEMRAMARDGTLVPRMSYTYPEIRQFALSILREVATLYPVDGVCVLYNRRPPLVEYEPPLVEGFMEKFGEDPRQIDEKDPRWLHYRCHILTQFMRDLRREMDAVAQETGRAKRIEVSAVVLSGEQEHLDNGMDLPTWIAEGLVDTVIPYTSAARLDSLTLETWTDPSDVDYWVSLTKGTACKLALNIMPRFLSPEQYRRRASALYQAGVDHLFFWDSSGPYGRADSTPAWQALRRLGHREEIEAWQQAGEPDLTPSCQVLRRLDDWKMAYATPG